MDKAFRLKAHLFEHGIDISSCAKRILDAQSDIWLMDDYITCSGVTLNFADKYATVGAEQGSPYKLIEKSGGFVVTDGKDIYYDASVITPPDYMKDEIVIGGKRITEFVNTYTDRIRLQSMCGCANSCKFCNAQEYGYDFNNIKDLDEAFQIALEQSNARHAFISTNNVKDASGFKKLSNLIEYFAGKYPEMNLDLMTSPRGFNSYTDASQYKPYLQHLKSVGIKGIAANLELNNPDLLKHYCPEKALIGQTKYLKFLEHSVDTFGQDNVRSLLIAGLEPLDETIAGVEKLAERGVNPVLSPLFPYGEAQGRTDAEFFIEAKERSDEICDKHKIKMGPVCEPCSHNTL